MKRLAVAMGLTPAPAAAVFAQFDHPHAAWTALLQKHVAVLDGGKASAARYAGFAQLLADAPADRKSIEDGQAPLAFLDCDWTLGDARRP